MDTEIQHRYVNVSAPFTSHPSRMHGGGEGIGVVGIDVGTPYRSPSADSFSLLFRKVEPRNTHSIGAVFLALKSRQRRRRRDVPELRLFV